MVPGWAQDILSHLIGILVLLVVINRILAQLQTNNIRLALSEAQKAGTSAAQAIKKALTLPTEHPRLEALALVGVATTSYFLALYFFAFSALLMFVAVGAENIDIWRRIIGLLITAIMLPIARYYFAEGERQRIAAIEKWRSICRKSS